MVPGQDSDPSYRFGTPTPSKLDHSGAMNLECTSCRRLLRRHETSSHLEQYHTGPRPLEILQLNCLDCEFRVPIEKSLLMIDHCVSEKHNYRGISEWRKFMQAEGERLDQLIQLGIETFQANMKDRNFANERDTSDILLTHFDFDTSDPELSISEPNRSSQLSNHFGTLTNHENMNEDDMKSPNPSTARSLVSTELSKVDIITLKTDVKQEDSDLLLGEFSDVEDPAVTSSSGKTEQSSRSATSLSADSSQTKGRRKIKRKSAMSESSSHKKWRMKPKGTSSTHLTNIPTITEEPFKSEEEPNSHINPGMILKQDFDHEMDGSEVSPDSEERSYLKAQESTSSVKSGISYPDQKYTCRICNHTQAASTRLVCDLIRHIALHDARLRRFQCATCAKRFNSKGLMRVHLQNYGRQRQCQNYILVEMPETERLKLIEELMSQAFPEVEIPEKYRPDDELAMDRKRSTCAVCKKRVRVIHTSSAVNHALRHDKSLGWYQCADCGMKLQNLSDVHRHASLKINDCSGEAKEMIGPEMAGKIQLLVNRCFPNNQWDVWNMRQMQKLFI